LSIHDLCETIVNRLKNTYSDPLPSNINISSDEWIHLQFCPTNSTTTQTMYYTGRFSVKFKVQSQMLRKSSKDAHYCAALFRYLREFSLKYDLISSESELLFRISNTLDDIHKRAQESSKLKSELKECISGVKEILNSQTKRLRLKNNQFKYFSLANEEAIAEIFEVNIAFIIFIA
ncbi:23620_t:CDS:2, partial [Racocetra persica]